MTQKAQLATIYRDDNIATALRTDLNNINNWSCLKIDNKNILFIQKNVWSATKAEQGVTSKGETVWRITFFKDESYRCTFFVFLSDKDRSLNDLYSTCVKNKTRFKNRFTAGLVSQSPNSLGQDYGIISLILRDSQTLTQDAYQPHTNYNYCVDSKGMVLLDNNVAGQYTYTSHFHRYLLIFLLGHSYEYVINYLNNKIADFQWPTDNDTLGPKAFQDIRSITQIILKFNLTFFFQYPISSNATLMQILWEGIKNKLNLINKNLELTKQTQELLQVIEQEQQRSILEAQKNMLETQNKMIDAQHQLQTLTTKRNQADQKLNHKITTYGLILAFAAILPITDWIKSLFE